MCSGFESLTSRLLYSHHKDGDMTERTEEATTAPDVATLLDRLDALLREPCDAMDRQLARAEIRSFRASRLSAPPAAPTTEPGEAERLRDAERVLGDFRNAPCLTALLGEDDCPGCFGCRVRAYFARHEASPSPA
jgi:hypothetical protein